MALNIGKKKDAPADDWSNSALDADAGSTPGASEPADTFGNNIVADASASARKSVSPILLAAGAVLLLTAIGLGVYFLVLNKPAQDDDAPIATAPTGLPPTHVGPKPVPAKPTPDKTPVGGVKSPVKTPVKSPVKSPATPVADPSKIAVKPAPGEIVKVKPGRAGLIPPGTKVPSVQSLPGKPASAVPKPNLPKPVEIMRDGEAGQQGKGLPAASAVPVMHPTSALPPALQAQLKTLWQQGAAAKHRGDKAAAKRAWQKMLQVRPGHPGVQEAIDKL